MQTARFVPAFRGVDTESSPEYVDVARGARVDNMLVGRDGKLVCRGSFGLHSDPLGAAATSDPVGAFVFDDKVLVGVAGTAARLVDLASTGGTMTTTSVTLAASDRLPGQQYTRLGSYVWGLNANNRGDAARKVLRWDGSATPANVIPQANAPVGAADVHVHLRSLFALGGSKPGTAGPIFKNKLWWSDFDGPTPDTVAAWSDDVSGIVNEIVLDGETNDFGVALAPVGQDLAILRRQSVLMLRGTSPANFAVRPVVREYGCVSAASVVPYGEGIFFLSDTGLIWFDGISARNVSGPVKSRLTDALRYSSQAYYGDGLNQESVARLDADYLLVSVSNAPRSFTAMYHVPTGAWSDVSAHTDIMPLGYPTLVDRSLTIPFAYDGVRVWRADELTIPRTTYTDFGSDIKNWLDVAAVIRTIPAAWYSRIERLASPVAKAQLQKVYVDYKQYPANGWQVSLTDGAETVLLAGTSLPNAHGAADAAERRQRATVDCFAEATEVQARVTLASANPGARIPPELYDIYVQYEAAQQR